MELAVSYGSRTSSAISSCNLGGLLTWVLTGTALTILLLSVPVLAASGTTGGTHIIQGPNVGRISGSSVTVTWTTDKAKAGKVKWGAQKGDYPHALKEAEATVNHSLTLTGLKQNKKYHFRVVVGETKSHDGTFTTANYSDAPFTFANMGDNRGETSDEDTQHVTPSFQNVLNAALAKSPAFTLHVGDLFIGHSDLAKTQQMYGVFKAAIQPLVATSAAPYPFTISPGNHEMRPDCATLKGTSEANCTPDFDPFVLFNQELPNQPQNGPPGYVGTAFSFDYGNTHVASIDACRFNASATTEDFDLYDLHDAVIDWLDADLAAAQQAHYRHLFVFGHPEAWAPDGIRWSAGSSGTLADLHAVSGRLAVGASGTILASKDGLTWAPQVSGTTATLRALAANPLFVAVGDSGTILTCAATGTTWTPRASGTTHDLRNVFSSGALFVAVGSAGTILTSSNGITWEAAHSGTTKDLHAVTQGSIPGHKMYVAVGKGGTILTSHDATIWTAQASGTTEDLLSITGGNSYGNPLLVAVGSAGTILTSLDSVTWIPQVSGVAANLNAVLCTHIFIALGDGGVVITSEDGIQWDPQVSGTTSDLMGIDHWDPDELKASQYYAVGADGVIATSPEWLGVSSLSNYRSQRDKLWQVLKNHGVDAYLCGHVHIFDDSFTVDGVVQWLDGNSGSTGVGNGRWTLWSIDGETATADLMDESGNATYTRVIQSSQP
jgi:hypothetical protein